MYLDHTIHIRAFLSSVARVNYFQLKCAYLDNETVIIE